MNKNPNELSHVIALRVQSARNRINKTVEQVSSDANIGVQTLKQLENGKTDCYVSTLYSVSVALGVSFDYLVGKEESNSTESLLVLFNSLPSEKRSFVEGLIYQVKLSPYNFTLNP